MGSHQLGGPNRGPVAHGKRNSAGDTWDLGEIINRCAQRLTAFCQHFGDSGLYHEGLGYQNYTCSNLLPALIALRNVTGDNVFSSYPALVAMSGSLSATICPRYNSTDDLDSRAPGCHQSLERRRARLGWDKHDQCSVELGASRGTGSHRAWYDRLYGHASPDQQFGGGYGGVRFFAAIAYPYATAPEDPNRHLPKHLCDNRQGLWVARNRYHDADDVILGAYARATHVGGHSHNDAGSIRLLALNHDWIIGGGQNRKKGWWQSCVCDADEAMRKQSQNRGLVIWNEADDQGAHGHGSAGHRCVITSAMWGSAGPRRISHSPWHDLTCLSIKLAGDGGGRRCSPKSYNAAFKKVVLPSLRMTALPCKCDSSASNQKR